MRIFSPLALPTFFFYISIYLPLPFYERKSGAEKRRETNLVRPNISMRRRCAAETPAELGRARRPFLLDGAGSTASDSRRKLRTGAGFETDPRSANDRSIHCFYVVVFKSYGTE